MHCDARRPSLANFVALVMLTLFVGPLAAQERSQPSGGATDERSASEILAAAAAEVAREKDRQPADPPAPPADADSKDAPPTKLDSQPDSPPEHGASPPADAAPAPPAEGDDTPAADHKDDDKTPAAPVDTASYNDVLPGYTTREELHKKWGAPQRVDRIPGGVREVYPSDAFEVVHATILEDVVDALTLKMKEPMAVDAVVERLQVGDVEPVDVFDDAGRLQGQAYPERGMLLGFDPQADGPRVSHIVIEQVNESAFLARAENRLPYRYAECQSDLRQALRLAPDSGRAHWLEAEVLLRTGDFESAIQSASKAIELAPQELEYRLTLAKVYSAAGDHRQAIEHAREVVETRGAAPLTLAKAACVLGDCLAAAPERDTKQAIEYHMQAARVAQPLTKSEKTATRRAAKEVLLDAYLGAAHDIGHGHWQQKAAVTSKWLEQALGLADDIIRHERGGDETRLRVDEAALATLAGIADPPDATRWIDGATRLGGALVRQAVDPAYKARLAWRLAVALGDATEIETARGRLDRALQLGNTAMAYFGQGESVGKRLPTHDYLRGWLCYRMGAIHAIHRRDHRQAVAWFRQAVPLLESPAPSSAVVNQARHGESFVSMAVSYWDVGGRQEALRLTEQGLKLMELAAADGQLQKVALAIPYGNLARMHQQAGDAQAAQKFAELAARAQALAPK